MSIEANTFAPPPEMPESFPQMPRQARLVVVETVYHQPADAEPTAAESRFGRWLTTDEQPYVRRGRIGEEWQPLVAAEACWLDQSSMVVITNQEGGFHLQPTEQQQAEMDARVLEVGREGSVLLVVPPGESARFQPWDLTALRVRCRSGEAKYTVAIFPV